MVDPPTGIRWDVRWGLPLGDGSVRRFHCEHFFEHLRFPDEVMPALAECFRVLEPGGELRIIVPDAARYIRAYALKDTEFFDAMRDLGGAATPFETDIEIVNQAFRMGGDHQFAWDGTVMRRRLEQVGFEHVEETGYDPTRFIDQGDEWRRRESLYVVAYKPRVAPPLAGVGPQAARRSVRAAAGRHLRRNAGGNRANTGAQHSHTPTNHGPRPPP